MNSWTYCKHFSAYGLAADARQIRSILLLKLLKGMFLKTSRSNSLLCCLNTAKSLNARHLMLDSRQRYNSGNNSTIQKKFTVVSQNERIYSQLSTFTKVLQSVSLQRIRVTGKLLNVWSVLLPDTDNIHIQRRILS